MGKALVGFPERPSRTTNSSIRRQDDLIRAVVVEVVDLASHVVVEFPAAELRIAPSPEDAAIEFLNRHRRGEVVVVLVEVLGGDNFDLAVAVHVARNNPITAVLRVERDRSPRNDNRRIGRRDSAGVGFEGSGLILRQAATEHNAFHVTTKKARGSQWIIMPGFPYSW